MAEWLIRDSRELGRVQHPSTEAALLAMQSLPLSTPPTTMLDIGCGSGILSLAACELWPEINIIASDISPQAVADASENIAHHSRTPQVHVLRADGYNHPHIRAQAPYSLVVCNLLAEWLIRFAPDLKTVLAPSACAVLSGIMAWQQAQVVEAHQALGFVIEQEIVHGEWRALTLTHL